MSSVKKRKFKDINSPENNKYVSGGVKLQNRFQVFSDNEENLTDMDEDDETVTLSNEESKTNKPKKQLIPPLVVYSNVKNHTETLNKLQALLKNPMTVKCKNNRVIFYTQTVEDYQALKNEISNSDVEYHTYSLSSDKEHKLVLKGLPVNVTDEEIMNDLESKMIKPVKIVQITRKINNEDVKLPIRIINYSSSTAIKEVVKNKYICYCVCSWERYKKPKKVTQCFNCQGFNHVASNCFKKPKCVKCANNHKTKECSIKNRTDNPICANCGGNHAASSKECSTYKKVWDSKFNTNSNSAHKIQKIRNINKPIYDSTVHAQDTTTYAYKLKGPNRSMNFGVNNNNNNANVFNDIKEFFSNINLNRIVGIIKETVLKLKNASDGFSKIAIIAESAMEIFS